MKHVTIKKEETAELLYKSGLLFEINRKILHPLGLALSVEVNDADEVTDISGIVDYRDDPEGMIFTPEALQEGVAKLNAYLKEHPMSPRRERLLGYIVQPLPLEVPKNVR